MLKRLVKALSPLVIRIVRIIKFIYWEGIYSRYKKTYQISKNFRFNGQGITFYGDGEIVCSENSYIGEYSSIQAFRECKVKIGNNCRISHYVHIYTANTFANQDFSKDLKIKSGNVTIGNYCWIGIKASIMGPVNIGDNSVIGANSLVNKDIPPHSISIGVPAKVIKFKSYLSKEDQVKLAKQYVDVLSEDLKKELIQ